MIKNAEANDIQKSVNYGPILFWQSLTVSHFLICISITALEIYIKYMTTPVNMNNNKVKNLSVEFDIIKAGIGSILFKILWTFIESWFIRNI
jgi:hypothetical protein